MGGQSVACGSMRYRMPGLSVVQAASVVAQTASGPTATPRKPGSRMLALTWPVAGSSLVSVWGRGLATNTPVGPTAIDAGPSSEATTWPLVVFVGGSTRNRNTRPSKVDSLATPPTRARLVTPGDGRSGRPTPSLSMNRSVTAARWGLMATSMLPLAAHSIPLPLASTDTPWDANEMEASTRPSAVSRRCTVPSLSDTHRRPSAASTSPTPASSGNGKVWTTRLVAGSMRCSVARAGAVVRVASAVATHTAPESAVSWAGSPSTWIVAITRLVAGSIRLTVPSPLLATHTDPPATSTAPGALPT